MTSVLLILVRKHILKISNFEIILKQSQGRVNFLQSFVLFDQNHLKTMCFISYALQVVARERTSLCDTLDPRERMNTREPQERHERRSRIERMRAIGAMLEA